MRGKMTSRYMPKKKADRGYFPSFWQVVGVAIVLTLIASAEWVADIIIP